jgi:hypothetical protein
MGRWLDLPTNKPTSQATIIRPRHASAIGVVIAAGALALSPRGREIAVFALAVAYLSLYLTTIGGGDRADD